MIRNLLATTAIATLVATGAFAQTTAPATETAPAAQPAAPSDAMPADQAQVERADGMLASNLIGETVYNGAGDDAENIGEVKDIVMSNDGNAEAVVIGVGGFLGLGEKNVSVEYDKIEWAERDGDRWIVISGASKDDLKALPDFDRSAYDPAPAMASDATAPAANDSTAMAPAGGAATIAPATNDTAAAPAETDATTNTAANNTTVAPADGDAASTDTAAAPAGSSTTGNNANSDTAAAPATGDAATTDTAAAPAANDNASTDTTQTAAIDKSTLKQTASADIRAEELVGTTVYGANDEDVGEIGDVILSQDGKVDSVIVDVGGFLGLGEKEVAVGLDNISFMTDADGNNYLYTNFTKEQLESQAEYDETTWAEQRDQQRMTIQQ